MTFTKTRLATSMIVFGLLVQPALSLASAGDNSRWQAHSQGQGGSGEGHGWARLADRLGLSDAQRQSMKAIGDKYRPELRGLRQQLADSREELAKADVTDARLHELAEAQCKASTRMIIARRNMRMEMDKVLTDEQRRKLESMSEHRWHRREWNEPEDRS
jgi:Spy/CpxP family protein refolding chaperone